MTSKTILDSTTLDEQLGALVTRALDSTTLDERIGAFVAGGGWDNAGATADEATLLDWGGPGPEPEPDEAALRASIFSGPSFVSLLKFSSRLPLPPSSVAAALGLTPPSSSPSPFPSQRHQALCFRHTSSDAEPAWQSYGSSGLVA